MNSSVLKSVRMVAFIGLAVALAAGGALAQSGKYLGPSDVVASQDGKTLFVVNSDANQVALVDVAGAKVARTIGTPAKPTGAVLSPDGKTLYVTCASPAGMVAMIDVASGNVTGSIAAGHSACGPSISPDGKRLYVCNQFDNDVSVIDVEAKQEVARVAATREPVSSAITPDGKTVFVANQLPADRADAYDVAAVVTAIDTATNQPTGIRLPNGSSSLKGSCVSPDGKQAYVVHILARYQMPTTQLERGWMNTNAMTIIDTETKKIINTVLLDDINLGGANPWGVACTPDGAFVCVTHAGTRELSVIDAPALLEKLAKLPPNKEAASAAGAQYDGSGSASVTAEDVLNDLAFLVGLRRRIKLDGSGPRGLAVVGTKAYACEYFSDTLAVAEVTPQPARVVSSIALGPTPVLSVQRLGERNFYDASLCFQHWQSCSSCHPETRMDGLNWDLMNDGIGNPKNVKSMLLAHQTPPAMSTGIRPDAEYAVRSGITHIQFAVRPEEDAVAIDEYLKALQPVPSPHLEDGKLSAAAERGKTLFFGDAVGCAKCHPAPLYSDLASYDVGSRGKYDRRDEFDTPTLVEVWRTAPYMHDGRYTTVKQLLTEGKHGSNQGGTKSLSPEQIDDLVEFVLSL